MASSCADRTRIRAPGYLARIRSIASRPPIPGMDMSITTTSGFTSGNLRQASSPLSDSATTLISAEPSSSNRKPMRTTAWSSTSITLMFPIDLPSTTSLLRRASRCKHGDYYRYGRALTRRAIDSKFAMQRLNAFPHANKPEPHGIPVWLFAKSFAIVAHRDRHHISLFVPRSPYCDGGLGCCGMPSHISKALLNDPIHGDIERFSHSVQLAFQTQITGYF